MTDQESSAADDAPALPAVVDRAAWQAEIDAIAAARRRLPMVEMDPAIALTGADGEVTCCRRSRVGDS